MDDDKKIRWVRSYRLDSKEIDRTPILRDEVKSFTVKTIKAQLRLMDISCKKAINRKDIEQLFFDFYEDIPSYSSAELKDKLRLAGVDDSKCVEKADLVTLLRQSIHCNVRGKFDGWVRSFNKSGGLSWIPANKWFMDAEIRLPNGHVLVGVKELRNASTLTFAGKLGWFRHKLSKMRVPWSVAHQKIAVRRSHLLGDAFSNLRALKPLEFWQIFRFEFMNEPAVDAGGVAREWFSEVGRALFNVDFGLFKYVCVCVR